MIDLYFWPTPNGYKVTVMCEEVGLKYNVIPINIGAGDQFKPEFLKISPNNRMPAIIDHRPRWKADRDFRIRSHPDVPRGEDRQADAVRYARQVQRHPVADV